jgi:eukaryotic-like serine/threonine-protein kinase
MDILGDRYQLHDPIGRGGMSIVYRGRDMQTDRVVAIKVLHDVYSADPKYVTRFQLEAKMMSLLHHLFLIMELCTTLLQLLTVNGQ